MNRREAQNLVEAILELPRAGELQIAIEGVNRKQRDKLVDDLKAKGQ